MRCRNVWCRFGPVSIKSRCVETTLNLQQQFTLLVSSRRPNSSFKIKISFFLLSSALLCPFVALPARQPTKLPSLTPPPDAALQIHPTNDHHHCHQESRLGKGWVGKQVYSIRKCPVWQRPTIWYFCHTCLRLDVPPTRSGDSKSYHNVTQHIVC